MSESGHLATAATRVGGASDPAATANVSIDGLHWVETPEGGRLALHAAGPVNRARAFAIDFAIRVGLFLLLSTILESLGDLGFGLLLLAAFTLEWLYPVIGELCMHGATPGKRLVGLLVVNDDGTPVSAGRSVARNLIRFVDFLPLLYAFGLLSMFYAPGFKRLGDLAAGTVVVQLPVERAARWSTLGGTAHSPEATAEGTAMRTGAVTPVPLTREEQRLLLDFAARAMALGEPRASEIAATCPALTAGAADPLARLLHIAGRLEGGR
ncbi:MAG: RDD family protein [Gammaproteobacteria bacterium]|nr:RDD family protein [Gammaproteobacteria bacterium]